LGSFQRRKALKSEAQERRELKEAFKSEGARSRREGSQTLGVELPVGRAKLMGRVGRLDVRRRVNSLEDAEGRVS
jgi:hypothetical protein